MVQILRDLLAPPDEDQQGDDPTKDLREIADGAGVSVGLNHLMFATELGGVGFGYGHGFSYGQRVQLRPRLQLRPRTSEYGVPGLGGRMPVRVIARRPRREPDVPFENTGAPW